MNAGIWSLAPAALAILLAIVSRNVILSLFAALVLAGTILTGNDPIGGTIYALENLVVKSITDADHAKTLLFTVLIGGTVGVIGKSGATRAVVEQLAKRAKSPRSVQMISWLSGLVVFFDDYANCMIVGSAMGPLFDRYRVSRAKLAYIVDSTAAPVASLALVSTWVGFEVGVVDDGLKAANIQAEPYGYFLQTWPYRFYPVVALLFVGMVVWTKRDFGPMSEASYAVEDGPVADPEMEATGNAPWWAALAPIVALIGVTIYVLWWTGHKKVQAGAPLFRILQNSDGYLAILLGAFVSLALATLAAIGTRSLNLEETTKAAVSGMKLMFEAVVILLLAWSLSSAMKQLHAPDVLQALVGDSLPAFLLPTIVFLVGAAISFAVGSSYTTMGVMMPSVIPLAAKLAADQPHIALAAAGSVLAGACFGDHCSPISDTTVLSSLGSGANHLEHVRTQLPYALLIGAISVIFGTLPAGLGVNPWICTLMCLAAAYGFLRWKGKLPETRKPPTDPQENKGQQAATQAEA